ncbi:MAG: hypothetical protein PUD44_03420, partial [Clostridiaceae bacterium]|nr:hypothetical protein [Clostridiaceae bacterium]
IKRAQKIAARLCGSFRKSPSRASGWNVTFLLARSAYSSKTPGLLLYVRFNNRFPLFIGTAVLLPGRIRKKSFSPRIFDGFPFSSSLNEKFSENGN